MIEDKEIRWIRYMTKSDPFIFRKYDYLIGKRLDEIKKELPHLKFSDYRTAKTLTCEAKYNWIQLRTSEDSVVEELMDICANE